MISIFPVHSEQLLGASWLESVDILDNLIDAAGTNYDNDTNVTVVKNAELVAYKLNGADVKSETENLPSHNYILHLSCST